MEKIERDGKVAVLYSPGYGAGWSTWAHGDAKPDVLCMDARIVQRVIDGDIAGAVAVAKDMFPDFYNGGADKLRVSWIEKGAAFKIEEYDGSESIELLGHMEFMTA